MQRPDPRVVESRADTMRLYDLSVFRLHHITTAAMQHPRLTQLRRSSAFAAVHATPRRLYGDQFHRGIIEKMIECSCRIAASTDTCDHMRGQFAPRLLPQLRPDLFADDTLEPCYHIGIGMRPYHTADDIMGIRRIVDPVPYR